MSTPRSSTTAVWHVVLTLALLAAPFTPVLAQQPAASADQANYIVGAQDVLVITSYDQPELTGKFTVEIDGTFTYPLIGRVSAGGATLREVEQAIRTALVEGGYFKNPQLTVAIETYRSQKVYVVGEVRTPGAYAMSGGMRLVEALALAGSTQPTAGGDVVVVRRGSSERATRVSLRQLEAGDLSQNIELGAGDTIFVPRAEPVYVFGQVKSPGAYPLRGRDVTVLQALSLAAGTTDRASTGRIKVVRIVDGKKVEARAQLTDLIQPHDTIVVPERFF